MGIFRCKFVVQIRVQNFLATLEKNAKKKNRKKREEIMKRRKKQKKKGGEKRRRKRRKRSKGKRKILTPLQHL